VDFAINVVLKITLTNSALKSSTHLPIAFSAVRKDTLLEIVLLMKKVYTKKEDHVSDVVQLDIYLRIARQDVAKMQKLGHTKILNSFDSLFIMVLKM
jgi:hypothetical protein